MQVVDHDAREPVGEEPVDQRLDRAQHARQVGLAADGLGLAQLGQQAREFLAKAGRQGRGKAPDERARRRARSE